MELHRTVKVSFWKHLYPVIVQDLLSSLLQRAAAEKFKCLFNLQHFHTIFALRTAGKEGRKKRTNSKHHAILIHGLFCIMLAVSI